MINSNSKNELTFSVLYGLAIILSLALLIALVVPPESLGFGF